MRIPVMGMAVAAALVVWPGAVDAEQVDLRGRWRLNAELSSAAGTQGGAPADPAGRSPGQGRPGGGRGGGGRGGHPGGMPGGRPGGGGAGPEQMARTGDAIREALAAPADLIVTRKEDEVVFTDAGTGDIRRLLVTGREMKSLAGGVEHPVRASYKNDALVVESSFGAVKVTDTWRVSPDGQRLERVTKIEGGPDGRGQGERAPVRRVYDRQQ